MRKIRLTALRKFVLLLVMVSVMTTGEAATALASVTSKASVEAIGEYTQYIRMKMKSPGRTAVPKHPLKTYNLDRKYKKLLKKVVSDKKVTSQLHLLDKGFSSRKKAIKAYWSLVRKYSPYVDYECTCYQHSDGKWYLYLHDSADNHAHYKNASKKKYKKAIEAYKKSFKKQLAVYTKRYGKLSQAEKVAVVLNYVAEVLDYGLGYVSYRSKGMFSGGDLYAAYKTHYGVCFDYSNLFYILCKSIGIECYRVAGMVQYSTLDKAGGHQWNIVKINGRYYYVDPTNDDRNTTTGVDYIKHYFGPRLKDLYYRSEIYLVY